MLSDPLGLMRYLLPGTLLSQARIQMHICIYVPVRISHARGPSACCTKDVFPAPGTFMDWACEVSLRFGGYSGDRHEERKVGSK